MRHYSKTRFAPRWQGQSVSIVTAVDEESAYNALRQIKRRAKQERRQHRPPPRPTPSLPRLKFLETPFAEDDNK